MAMSSEQILALLHSTAVQLVAAALNAGDVRRLCLPPIVAAWQHI